MDNLILIATSISQNSKLFQALLNHKNIKNVKLIPFEGDDVNELASSDAVEMVERTSNVITGGENHSHFKISNSEETRQGVVDELVQGGVE